MALAFATLVAAVAVGAARERRLVDARKDANSGLLDIVGLRFGAGGDGRLRAVVTMAGAWENGELLAAGGGPPGSVCLRLYTEADPGARPPDYLACATARAVAASTAQATTTTTAPAPTATTQAPRPATLRGELLVERPGELPVPTGAIVAVSRPSKRSITLRFSRSAIGRPASVRFVAEATRAGCPRTSCSDRLPDSPRTALVRLRAR